ncbi:MAG: peptide chain release factor N(5)-glutamine methyltransferase [Flavobacteriales bacterium]
MFVSDNTLASAKNYFYDRLAHVFSTSELKSMWKQIICKRMGWDNTAFLLQQDARLSESDLLYIRSFVKGLLNEEPFQYLLGETHFFGLNISCDARALIPRPETEELVAWAQETLSNPNRIVDLCTGTGCIALALKSVFPAAHVQAVDVSTEALTLAKSNADKLQLSIECLQEDVLQFRPEFLSQTSFDLIISNPPYIPEKEKEIMSNHVLNHEPSMALFVSDNDPIIFYKHLIQFAQEKLASEGYLFLELHESYSQEVLNFIETFSFQQVEVKRDLQGKWRMLKAQKV